MRLPTAPGVTLLLSVSLHLDTARSVSLHLYTAVDAITMYVCAMQGNEATTHNMRLVSLQGFGSSIYRIACPFLPCHLSYALTMQGSDAIQALHEAERGAAYASAQVRMPMLMCSVCQSACARMPVLRPNHVCLCLGQSVSACAWARVHMPVHSPLQACQSSSAARTNVCVDNGG